MQEGFELFLAAAFSWSPLLRDGFLRTRRSRWRSRPDRVNKRLAMSTTASVYHRHSENRHEQRDTEMTGVASSAAHGGTGV